MKTCQMQQEQQKTEQMSLFVNGSENVNSATLNGRIKFEQIHYTKEQIHFYERAENHKVKE